MTHPLRDLFASDARNLAGNEFWLGTAAKTAMTTEYHLNIWPCASGMGLYYGNLTTWLIASISKKWCFICKSNVNVNPLKTQHAHENIRTQYNTSLSLFWLGAYKGHFLDRSFWRTPAKNLIIRSSPVLLLHHTSTVFKLDKSHSTCRLYLIFSHMYVLFLEIWTKHDKAGCLVWRAQKKWPGSGHCSTWPRGGGSLWGRENQPDWR